jgi:hypothetical protein
VDDLPLGRVVAFERQQEEEDERPPHLKAKLSMSSVGQGRSSRSHRCCWSCAQLWGQCYDLGNTFSLKMKGKWAFWTKNKKILLFCAKQ